MDNINLFSDMCFNENYIESFISSKISNYLNTASNEPGIVNGVSFAYFNRLNSSKGLTKSYDCNIGSCNNVKNTLEALNYSYNLKINKSAMNWSITINVSTNEISIHGDLLSSGFFIFSKKINK